jgi:hypothetical protein
MPHEFPQSHRSPEPNFEPLRSVEGYAVHHVQDGELYYLSATGTFLPERRSFQRLIAEKLLDPGNADVLRHFGIGPERVTGQAEIHSAVRSTRAFTVCRILNLLAREFLGRVESLAERTFSRSALPAISTLAERIASARLQLEQVVGSTALQLLPSVGAQDVRHTPVAPRASTADDFANAE